MASKLEQHISRSLRTILADLPNGADIEKSKQFHDVLIGLEYWVPELLEEVYSDWSRESLDGIDPVLSRKTREGEAEIFGQCYIMSDQTRTPIHIRLQIASSANEVSWLEFKLGERGKYGMVRTPPGSGPSLSKLYGREDTIDWVYKVTFGQRRL